MSDTRRDNGLSSVLSQFTLALAGILLAGNIFFIKRLDDTLDEHEKIIWELRQSVAIMKVTLDDLLKYKMRDK